ncbi:MAG: hypothetical protein ACTII3_04380 [Galactobacter sp.]
MAEAHQVDHQRALKRVVRRETHSPRTVAAVAMLTVISLVAILALVELVLSLVGVPALVMSPGQAAAGEKELPHRIHENVVFIVVVALCAFGAVLLWLGLAPGKRPRRVLHTVHDQRDEQTAACVAVVDHAVIAAAIARAVAKEAAVNPDAVVVGIGHRSADVTVKPGPGYGVDAARIKHVVAEQLQPFQRRSPRIRVRAVDQRGKRPFLKESTP